MAIRINFDAANNPEIPTIVLAKKNGDKIGQLNAKSISISDAMNDASEITFNIHKFIDGVKCKYWEQIVDFKLIYCVEWDMWFSITIDLDESTDIQKTIFATRLGNYELSQIMLYEIEINTENDIERDDYKIPTVLYNIQNPEASLLHRIMEKAPHYTIIHVDDTIANIQRTFTFDGISIYDAFQNISKEINCLFVFNSNSDENGRIQRTISVYDLESNCIDCGYRGEYTGVCPECGGVNIIEGYGEDTTIFITSDELADNIQLTTDSGSVKNCFKLEAGDDLMTATIRNCNPNGTDYIWYISDSMKDDMSDALVEKINNYDVLYEYYRNKYNAVLNDSKVIQYNFLVSKYEEYNNTLKRIIAPVTGYSSIMNVYYNIIDFILYLQTSMMPTVNMSNTSALEQSLLLTTKNLSPVSVSNINYLSLATADTAVLSMANVIIDSRYRVKINSSSIVKSSNEYVWTGNFIITNYSDETDTAVSDTISITINDNYSYFIKQKINQSLKKDNTDDLSISGLFAKDYDSFVSSLQLYSLDCLKSFQSSCQSCIDILIEQGIGTKETWDGQNPNLYNDLYTPYVNKLMAIEAEMKVRSDEIAIIQGSYDVNHELLTYGLQNYIEDEILSIQKDLDFQNYLGNDLWLEFCTYRREDKYSNSNYISDGLDNAELFKQANEFIESAQNEIYKSFELQHSISTSLKNLLTIKKFKPLVNQFKVGNWLRIMVDDKIYKLRLIKYEIDYDNLQNITVEFSDVVNANSTISSVQDVINQAGSMATSYASVQKQAQQGEKSNAVINEWVNYGLDATNTKIVGDADYQNQTWDRHGMLFRKYDTISNEYSPIQLKIINSTIAITDDNWKSTKTAIGNFKYYDYQTKQIKSAYGINGEVIVGRLLIGQGLGIYNSSGSLTFDENGFQVTNNINTVVINPNNPSVFNIKNNSGNVLSFDENGNLIIVGDITARSLTLLDNTEIDHSHISGLSDVAISGKYSDLTEKPDLSEYLKSENLSAYIQKDGVIGSQPSEGSTGFTVSKDGLLQASNAIIYGTLYSSVGKIGGWNISNNSLYNGTSSITSTAVGTYIGTDGIRLYKNSSQYINMKNGLLEVAGGTIKGSKVYGSTIRSFKSSSKTLNCLTSIENGRFGVYSLESYNGEENYISYPDRKFEISCLSDGHLFLETPWFICENDDNYGISTSTGINCNGNINVVGKISTAGTITTSSTITSNGSVHFCKTGGAVYVYPQSTSSATEGGEIRLVNVGLDSWSKVQDSVNIDNYDGDLRFYLYDDDGKHHAARLYKDGTFATEKFRIDGVDVKPHTLTTGGVSCYFTYTDSGKHFRPPYDDDVRLGLSNYRWSEVWCNQSSINSASDERIKNIEGEIEKAEELIRAIHPIQYRFKNGTSGRTHYGFGSQTFKNDLISVGLDPNKIAAFLCDVTEEALERGITLETASEDEKIYGLRYSELISPMVSVIQNLLNRVDELEKLLN